MQMVTQGINKKLDVNPPIMTTQSSSLFPCYSTKGLTKLGKSEKATFGPVLGTRSYVGIKDVNP